MTRTLSLMLLSSLALAPAAISAEPSATQALEYREVVFEGLGKHMKAMGLIVKGKADRPASDLAAHAQGIAAAAALIPTLFPAGTGPDALPTTEALPAIWEKPDAFTAAAKKLQDEATKLVEIASKGDLAAAKAQFGAVGQACGSCHETFRKDDT